MTQLAIPTDEHHGAHEAHEMLIRRHEDAYTMWRREEAVVAAMRSSLDTGPGDEVDHATTHAQLDEQIVLADTLHTQVDDLATAIERCEAGTYGNCERCGRPIPVERLELFPAAIHCVACKQALERR
jgi:RNA polymerase-binding transcription factor DksA